MRTIDFLFKTFFIAGLLLPLISIAFFNPEHEEINALLFIGIASAICLLFIYFVSKPLKP